MCFKKNCIFLAVKCVPLYVSTKHFTDCSSYSHPFLSLSCLTSALLDSPSCQSSCGLPGHGHDQTTSADIPSKDASPFFEFSYLYFPLFCLLHASHRKRFRGGQ